MSVIETIETKDAPAAIGPYSQAVSVSGFVFASGQIPIDPRTGKMVEGEAALQAEQVLENLAAVLHAASSAMDRVVKTTIYLVDIKDFSAVNEVYERHFGSHRPARATVSVSALPKGARVEIDAVAVTR